MKHNERLIKISEKLYQAAFDQCLHNADDPTKTDENDAYRLIEGWAESGKRHAEELIKILEPLMKPNKK